MVTAVTTNTFTVSLPAGVTGLAASGGGKAELALDITASANSSSFAIVNLVNDHASSFGNVAIVPSAGSGSTTTPPATNTVDSVDWSSSGMGGAGNTNGAGGDCPTGGTAACTSNLDCESNVCTGAPSLGTCQ